MMWLASMAVHIKGQSMAEQEYLTIAAAASASNARRGREPISFYVSVVLLMLSDLDYFMYLRRKFQGGP